MFYFKMQKIKNSRIIKGQKWESSAFQEKEIMIELSARKQVQLFKEETAFVHDMRDSERKEGRGR